MSLMPIQPRQNTPTSQTVDLLTSKNRASRTDNGLANAANSIANVGKAASFIPGIGPAIGAACGLISGFLSFLASPCG